MKEKSSRVPLLVSARKGKSFFFGAREPLPPPPPSSKGGKINTGFSLSGVVAHASFSSSPSKPGERGGAGGRAH